MIRARALLTAASCFIWFIICAFGSAKEEREVSMMAAELYEVVKTSARNQ